MRQGYQLGFPSLKAELISYGGGLVREEVAEKELTSGAVH